MTSVPRHAPVPSPELGKVLDSADIQAARDLFHGFIDDWFGDGDDQATQARVILASRFVAGNLENPVFRDVNEGTNSSAVPEAIGFMAHIARTMVFEKEVINQRAQNLANIVNGLAGNATLREPVTLLSTEGQDHEAATTTLGVALATITGVTQDEHAPYATAARNTAQPDGRRGTIAWFPIAGGNLQLELHQIYAGEANPQAELQLVLAPAELPATA